MESALKIDTQQQRGHICLRLDGGFGTDENINHALWLGYQLLVMVFSGNRAKVLAQSVEQWDDVTPDGQAPRQAGWVQKPHRYGRTTRQLAIRKPNKKGGYRYVVLVITDMEADLLTLLGRYDARSGVPESMFCQDNQGLAQRKLRKQKFEAQQMLSQPLPLVDQSPALPDIIAQTKKSIEQRGIKRWVRQMFALSGRVVIKRGSVTRLILNAAYPLIDRFVIAFETLLGPYGVHVCIGKT